MKIISKFQDFYDSALAFGRETDRTLVRHTHVWTMNSGVKHEVPVPSCLELMYKKVGETSTYRQWGQGQRYGAYHRPQVVKDAPALKDRHLQLTPIIYLVAGKAIKALWCVDVRSKRLNTDSFRTTPTYLPKTDPNNERLAPGGYQANEHDTVLTNSPLFNAAEYEASLKDWLDALANEKETATQTFFGERYSNPHQLLTWLKEPLPDMYLDAMDNKVAAAVITSSEAVLNPRLKDWKFFKYWDATTCMQELSMFVGNMAAPDNVPLVLDDKYRLQSHGFDQQSFRKQPTKHADPKRAKRPHPDTPSEPSLDM